MIRWLIQMFGMEVMPLRSPKWSKVRYAHLMIKPRCEVCAARSGLEVHHIKPYHLWPELELEPSNLMTLCKRDHLLFGHLGDWKAYNPQAKADAQAFTMRIRYRPYHRTEIAL